MKTLLQAGSLLLLLILGACSGKDTFQYQGPRYAPVEQVRTVFQPTQLEDRCRLFAHLLVYLPAGLDGQGIRSAIESEAGRRGADTLLIGQSRQGEKDIGLQFHYYGPDQEYACRERWNGWKFGYEAWGEQGDWVNIGYREWGNREIVFDYPVVMQAAFLRCRD